jgi:hypothetical protein
VIIPALRASGGGHDFIMALRARGASDRLAIANPDRLKWRELAQKTAECRDKLLGKLVSLIKGSVMEFHLFFLAFLSITGLSLGGEQSVDNKKEEKEPLCLPLRERNPSCGYSKTKPKKLVRIALGPANDVIFEALGEYAFLEKIHILGPGSAISEMGKLQHLVRLKNLKMLYLRPVKITDHGAAILSQCISIQDLQIAGDLTDRCWISMAKLKRLTSLTVSSSQTRGEGIKSLASIPSLRNLCLINMKLSDIGAHQLRHLLDITKFELIGTTIPENAMKKIVWPRNITTLRLDGFCKIRDFRSLGNLARLREVVLVGYGLSESQLKEIASLKQVRTLRLIECVWTDAGIDIMGKMGHLKKLHVPGLKKDDLNKIQLKLPGVTIIE